MPTPEFEIAAASVALVDGSVWFLRRNGPGTKAAMKNTGAILKDHGATVAKVLLLFQEIDTGVDSTQQQKVIMSREAEVAVLREYQLDKMKVYDEICKLDQNKTGHMEKNLTEVLDSSARTDFDRLFEKYSVVIFPSAVDEAPLGLDEMGSTTLNTIWTVSYLFMSSIPFGAKTGLYNEDTNRGLLCRLLFH